LYERSGARQDRTGRGEWRTDLGEAPFSETSVC
jgi:hypothetical protein